MEKKDFSLDHILMMAIAELEESSTEEFPSIYIDDRFKGYSISLNDQQISEMIYSIQSKILPLCGKGFRRLDILVLVDDDNPNIVDLGVSVDGNYIPDGFYDEEALAS